MSLAFYFDEHAHRAIADGLRLRGIDVLTVQDDGMDRSPDPVVMDRALELRRVVFTQDSDFLREAVARQRSARPFYGVIYGHQLAVSVGQCIDDLEFYAVMGEEQDVFGQIIYLPLKRPRP